ncbi:MAG: hypothetical protein V9E94_20825 [Microthrixaceae bacterium]
MSAVAAATPDAAFAEQRDRDFLRGPGPGNRPLAHPYAKWHCAQWGVDQAAALVLCSVAVARELDVPRNRWVFPRVLVESSSSVPLSCRAELHRWPAMAVLGRVAQEHLGVPLSSIGHVDLYSCFPVAVRVQQRELGLDPNATPTSTGGMAFGGGPFNNYTYQSTAAVVAAVRADPGSLGLVSTVSGLLTKPALGVWSTEPGALRGPCAGRGPGGEGRRGDRAAAGRRRPRRVGSGGDVHRHLRRRIGGRRLRHRGPGRPARAGSGRASTRHCSQPERRASSSAGWCGSTAVPAPWPEPGPRGHMRGVSSRRSLMLRYIS